MAFSFLYLPFRALLVALVRGRRGLDVKDIELLGLRARSGCASRKGGGITGSRRPRSSSQAAAAYPAQATAAVVTCSTSSNDRDRRAILREHEAVAGMPISIPEAIETGRAIFGQVIKES